ncbi:MAG: hypothetical protein K8W52_41410 [Deltaproteobacteria bacterium]|nr:hypothetical protein [Deltaproteobacteria bacterium]
MRRLAAVRLRSLAAGLACALPLVTGRAAHAESPAPPPVRAVDLLVVVDSSPGATVDRAALVAGLPAFTAAIGEQFRGDYASPAIDLHVGVITADRADHGALRTASVETCAAAPAGGFVQYQGNQWGQVSQNFTGTLADAIACLVPSDTTGAAAAEPLAAIRTALDGSVPGNAGFLRADATLAVLVITDQDDCSSTGAPLDTFACAEAAWACTPAIDATRGPRSTCTARPVATGLVGIYDAVNFLYSLKVSSSLIAFGVVRGAPTPVSVISGPAIAPSCSNGARTATPGLRLDAIAAEIHNSWTEVACDDAGIDGFVVPIVAATYAPVGGDYYHGECDGGFYPGDDSGVGGHGADHAGIGCGCAAGAPHGGTGVLVALGFAVALRRRRRR